MLSKGVVHPEELEFVRASLVPDEYPTEVAGFELIEKIGEGSMGVVYRARQKSLDRIVALKILSPRLARNARYVARFEREARAVAKLSHPNIVGGIDVGFYQGFHYFAMELVEGRSIQEMIEEGPLPEKRALEIALKVAEALSHAWDRGLVHRDIKPANIIITADGTVKITDLGLAKNTMEGEVSLTDTGTTLGTAYYLSPEQAKGESTIDTRTDIYSLGGTLYHMLTGSPPYHGTPVSVMTQHVSAPVPDPKVARADLSEGTSAVVKMMMAKDRRERYRTPDDLIIDIKRLLEGRKPLLARSDVHMAVLADAADYEDEAIPEMVTREQMRKLKRELGWGSRRVNLRLGVTIIVVALVWMAVVFGVLYMLGVLET